MAEGWTGQNQGMTIRDILEKVDLFNVSVHNSSNNQKGGEKHLSKDLDGKTIIETADPASAYLGPKLWDKQISLDLGLDLDTDDSSNSAGSSVASPLESLGLPRGREQRTTSNTSSASDNDLTRVMNMEEFLAENGLSLDMEPTIPMEICNSPEQGNIEARTEIRDVKPNITRPNVIMNVPKVERRVETQTPVFKRALEVESEGEADDPAGVSKPANDFLYAESKRARLEREKAEKRRKFELELEFAPEDLALATVPGAQFDPSTRHFDVEELRPQPIIRKRKRIYVPDDAKDDKYWANRIKNNVAARRSREARRLKENQIALRAAFLEKENRILKQELDDIKFDNTKLATERDILKMKLARYEKN